MTLQEYTDKLKYEFAYYGFTEPPLSDEQIEHLFIAELSIDDAYLVGCDVFCGYPFDASIDERANPQE